ncbi:MAG: L,D-transpeptidase [Telluria sp.]|nr:L,D-transpeptidase [Telluria sp.]
MIVDKKNARVFVFYPNGKLRGAAAVLLGEAVGDDSVPGIGERKLSSIRPEERTTPAGRFVAAIDRNIHGKDILWVDYAAAISLHRVVTNNPKERRAERLATPTSLDNRISYGCINVPAAFFNKIVMPAFTKTNGIVYVLPETRSLQQVFAALSVAEQARLAR